MKTKLQDLGLDFGSRRWGGWYDDSDYDRLVEDKDFKEACAYLDVNPRRDHKYDSNGDLGNDYHCYLEEDGKKYNFLVYRHVGLFNMAVEARNQIDVICRTAIGETMRTDKTFRHFIVQKAFSSTKKLLAIDQGLTSIYSIGEGTGDASTYPKKSDNADIVRNVNIPTSAGDVYRTTSSPYNPAASPQGFEVMGTWDDDEVEAEPLVRDATGPAWTATGTRVQF